jgi:hypothetical protein
MPDLKDQRSETNLDPDSFERSFGERAGSPGNDEAARDMDNAGNLGQSVSRPSYSTPLDTHDQSQVSDYNFNRLGRSMSSSLSKGTGSSTLDNLVHREKNPNTGSDNSLGAKTNKPGGGSIDPVLEGKHAAHISDQVGKGFAMAGPEAAVATKVASKIRQSLRLTVKEHKGLVFGGAGGIIGIIIFIFGLAGVADLALNHFTATFLGYESKTEKTVEDKIAKSLMQRMICRALPLGCKNKNGNPQENDKATPNTAEEEQQAAAQGETLTEDMDKFSLTSTSVKDALAKAGITVETDGSGNFAGLRDANGNNITESIATDDNAFNELSKALPEWEVGQRDLFRSLLTEEAGATWEPMPQGTSEDKVPEAMESDVSQGASSTEIDQAVSETNQSNAGTDKNGNPLPPDQVGTEVQDAGNKIATAENAVVQAENAGESGSAALSQGLDVLKSGFKGLGSSLFIAGFIATLCHLEQAIAMAANARIPEIMTLLIRHGTTLLSLTSEKNAGQLTAGQVDGVMSMIQGDPNAPAGSDASKPATASAAYQRATGGIVDTNPKDINTASYTPPISPSSLPVKNAGQVIVDDISSVLKETGANYICSALLSPFGFFIQAGLGVIQVIGDGVSGGVAQVGITAALVGANTTLNQIVLPQILQYFAPIGLNGREDSVQWANNTDAGLNLAFGNYSRRLGGLPQRNSEANTSFSQAKASEVLANSAQSFSDRMFAVSNPDSLVSHLADYLPIGLGNSISSFAGYFSSFPETIAHTFSSIFTHSTLAAAETANPGVPYDITQYGLSDNQIEQYDPIANEQYLFSPVTPGSNIRLIDVLGNPNTLTVDSSGNELKSNGQYQTQDLLHCFVDSYSALYQNTQGVQSNCNGIGIYDYANNRPNYTKHSKYDHYTVPHM